MESTTAAGALETFRMSCTIDPETKMSKSYSVWKLPKKVQITAVVVDEEAETQRGKGRVDEKMILEKLREGLSIEEASSMPSSLTFRLSLRFGDKNPFSEEAIPIGTERGSHFKNDTSDTKLRSLSQHGGSYLTELLRPSDVKNPRRRVLPCVRDEDDGRGDDVSTVPH